MADLVGAGLPAMASLRFGGTTEVPVDREQARSYRNLWWPADLVGAGLPAMASLRFGGATETPMAREQARSYRDLWWPAAILWELACQRWHHCGLAERARCQWIASKLAPTGVCGGRRQSCGSWLASDGITAVWLNERGANGSRASSLLQEFVVAGGNLVGAGLPAMTSLRSGGTTETPMDREQARSYRDLWWPAAILWELACQR